MKIKLLSKNRNTSVLLMFFLLLTASFANAANITSAGTGNWATGSTWVGGAVPLANDNVTIAAGHTVTVTVSASIINLNLSTTTSKLVINSGQTLTVTGTFANLGTTTNGVNGPGTLLFTGTATFGVLTPTGVPPNVVIGNGISTNTVTVGVNTLVTAMTINPGATLNIGIRTLTVSGFFTNNGAITGTSGQINTTSGASTNNGSIVLTSGRVTLTTGTLTNNGSISMTTGRLIQSSGSITNAATGSIAFSGTGTITFATGNFINLNTSASVNFGTSSITITGTAASQSIGGFTTTGIVSMTKTSGTVTFTGNVNGAGLTINGAAGTLNLGSGLTHIFTGTWTRTAGTLNGGSSILKIGGSISGTAGTFSAGTGTVEYNKNGSQTCAVVAYNNLTLSGTGTATKTFAAVPTVNGILSLEGTATVTVTTGTITYGAASTLQYNKPAAYTATTEEWPATFSGTGGVRIVNTGVISLGAIKNVTNNFSIATGASANLGTFTHTAGTLSIVGSGVVAGTWGSTSSAAINKNNTYFASTTGMISVTNGTCILPVITSQPAPQTICENTGGTFTVATSAPTPTYQWQYSSDMVTWINIDVALAANLSGYITDILTVTNAPIAWSNLYNVRCLITSAAGCIVNSNPTLLTVAPTPTAPVIGAITPLTCAIPTASVALSGLPASAWTITMNPGGITTLGSGTTTTITEIASGNYTFTVSSGTCVSGSSASVLINPLATNTWNGTSWFLGAPTADQNIVFAGNYSVATNVVGCGCTLSSGAITIPSGNTITVTNAITGAATLTLENNASLIQTNDTAINTASIIVKRNTTPIIHDDFTYWSSPTTGPQTLSDFSPATQWDKFASYLNDWVYETPTTKTFDKGIGYAIRGEYGDATPVVRPHQFTGVPNNGDVVIPVAVRTSAPDMGIGEILAGNPYPSTLDADAFIDANLVGTGTINQTISGTLYFWTHNHTLTGYNYDGNDYATYTKGGGTAAGAGPSGSGNATSPTRYIASGQGFFVDFEADGNMTFTNDMRVGTNNTNFYKIANPKTAKKSVVETHRIWLNLTNSTVNFSQALVGYVADATNDYDPGFDGRSYGGAHDLYSILDAEILTIQARSLPFVNTDLIPLGYSVTVAGSTTITIDHVDGVFLGSQGIYLEDKALSITHDLKASPYTFYSDAGNFEERFILKYTNAPLGNEDFKTIENKVLVSVKNKQIKINAAAESIDKVIVYDLLGKQIYKKEKASSQEVLISNLPAKNQVLIIKTTFQSGKTVLDKIVY